MSINEVSNNRVIVNFVVSFVIICYIFAVYMWIFAYFITDLTYMSQALREKYKDWLQALNIYSIWFLLNVSTTLSETEEL